MGKLSRIGLAASNMGRKIVLPFKCCILFTSICICIGCASPAMRSGDARILEKFPQAQGVYVVPFGADRDKEFVQKYWSGTTSSSHVSTFSVVERFTTGKMDWWFTNLKKMDAYKAVYDSEGKFKYYRCSPQFSWIPEDFNLKVAANNRVLTVGFLGWDALATAARHGGCEVVCVVQGLEEDYVHLPDVGDYHTSPLLLPSSNGLPASMSNHTTADYFMNAIPLVWNIASLGILPTPNPLFDSQKPYAVFYFYNLDKELLSVEYLEAQHRMWGLLWPQQYIVEDYLFEARAVPKIARTLDNERERLALAEKMRNERLRAEQMTREQEAAAIAERERQRAEEARRAIENKEAAYAMARELDIVEAYRKFLADYPDGEYADAARQRMGELAALAEADAYEKALQLSRGTREIAHLQEFLAQFPGSKFRLEALKWIEELRWHVRIVGNANIPRDIPILKEPSLASAPIQNVQPKSTYLLSAESDSYFEILISEGKKGYVFKGLAEKY